MNKLSGVFNSRRYWAGLTLIAVAAFAVALYYQYGVGDEPCQVCIHARLWVAALALIGAVMCWLPLNRGTQLVGNGLVVVSGAGLGERAWYLYQLENGIPIIPFYDSEQNKNDEELMHLIYYFKCIADSEDVRI